MDENEVKPSSVTWTEIKDPKKPDTVIQDMWTEVVPGQDEGDYRENVARVRISTIKVELVPTRWERFLQIITYWFRKLLGRQ